MLLHLLWLRELLENGILSALHWLDTRAMSADGHTKGSIERDTLRELAGGVMRYVKPDMVKILKLRPDRLGTTPAPERQAQSAAGTKRPNLQSGLINRGRLILSFFRGASARYLILCIFQNQKSAIKGSGLIKGVY